MLYTITETVIGSKFAEELSNISGRKRNT